MSLETVTSCEVRTLNHTILFLTPAQNTKGAVTGVVMVFCNLGLHLPRYVIIIIVIWLYNPFRALASPVWCFVTITFLPHWIVSPAPNPQPGGPGLRIYDPRTQSGPAIPPGTGYPF
jgi:hypothetical protein